MRSRTANRTSPATSKICRRFMICERWVSTVLMLSPSPWAISRRLAAHYQSQDLQLAGCKVMGVGRWRLGLLGAGQGLVDHGMGNRRAQVPFAVAQGFQGMPQLGSRGVLEQIAVGPGLQGLHDQGRVGMHRQDQDLALRAGRLESAQRFQAAGMLHRQVQQDDVRMELLDHFQQVRAIVGFTDHGVSGNIHDQRTHASPDERVVIHQE